MGQGRGRQLVLPEQAGGSEGDDDATPGKKVEWSIKLAEWSGQAGVWSDGVSKEGAVAGVDLKGAAGVSGTAYLAQASANGSAQYGLLGAQGEAEAFAGAKVTGAASADVAGVGAGASGEAWAGAGAGTGAEAKADLGMKDGKFTAGRGLPTPA